VQAAVAVVVIVIWSFNTALKRRERAKRLRRRERQLRSVDAAVEEAADPSAVA